MVTDRGDITRHLDSVGLLMLSDERDAWLARTHSAQCEGYDVGRLDGYSEGWAAAEDHDERAHQAVAARVLETPQQSAARRLRAAEAGCRHDAAEHWRKRWAELYALSHNAKFLREAYSEEPLKRSYDQTMALLLRARQRGAA